MSLQIRDNFTKISSPPIELKSSIIGNSHKKPAPRLVCAGIIVGIISSVALGVIFGPIAGMFCFFLMSTSFAASKAWHKKNLIALPDTKVQPEPKLLLQEQPNHEPSAEGLPEPRVDEDLDAPQDPRTTLQISALINEVQEQLAQLREGERILELQRQNQ